MCGQTRSRPYAVPDRKSDYYRKSVYDRESDGDRGSSGDRTSRESFGERRDLPENTQSGAVCA